MNAPPTRPPSPRRSLLLALAASALAPGRPAAAATGAEAPPVDDPIRRGRAIRFPRDHGAHLGARTEWWYATGWLGPAEAPTAGFQLTFFRSRTGLAQGHPSRFAARHLLFAHAALTTLARDGRPAAHRHDSRMQRWNGEPGAALGFASTTDGHVVTGRWWLRRDGEAWRAQLPADGFALDLQMTRTQPVLLQGDAGFSRKGPQERQASHYYSEPQLAVRTADGQTGRAWLDHEWSEEILHPEALGWDWIGFNLLDGSALTAFQLRRRDGSAVWAGGSFRPAGGTVRAFAPEAVRFEAGRTWTSPSTAARYPVGWRVSTPAGSFTVNALLDAQEMDARSGSGTLYWEGLSELLDGGGRRVGLGYLEMTGYAGTLRL